MIIYALLTLFLASWIFYANLIWRIYMATTDPLAPLSAALQAIQDAQAAAKVASDKLIADIQKLLPGVGQGQVVVSAATLATLLAQAQGISNALAAETASEVAEDAVVNPPAPAPAAPAA
jgi:hypothetical protein